MKSKTITPAGLGATKSKTAYTVDPRVIKIDDKLNPRMDYGTPEDWIEFKNSIREKGVQQNLKVFIDQQTQEFHLYHGFRRMKAVLELIEEGVNIETVPFDEVSPNEEEAIVDHFVLNNGKPLNDVEMAEGLHKLKVLSGDASLAEISKRIGLDYQKAHNLYFFAEHAGTQLKKQVVGDAMSFSTAFNIAKTAKSVTEQNKMIKEGVIKAKKEGKDKIRGKHIAKISEQKVSFEVKLGNILIEAEKDPHVDREVINMIQALMKAIKEGKDSKDIVHILNLQLAHAS